MYTYAAMSFATQHEKFRILVRKRGASYFIIIIIITTFPLPIVLHIYGTQRERKV